MAEFLPGWDEIKAEAKKWVNKFFQMKKDLFSAGQDIEVMKNILARYPEIKALQEQRPNLLALSDNQSKHEKRFFDLEAQFLQLLEQLGIDIPGLSGKASPKFIVPIIIAAAIISAIVKLYFVVSSHLSEVEREKALILRLSPEEAREELERRGARGGFFSEAKNLILIGIAAVFLMPLITRR